LKMAITSQFGFLGTDILSVQASQLAYAGPPGQGAPNPLSDDLPDKIAKLHGVEASFGRYLASGTLEFNDRIGIGYAFSMPDGTNRKVLEKMLNVDAEQGRTLKDGDRRKLFLGHQFSTDGPFGKGIRAGDTVLLQGFKYTVVGIMEKKGSFLLDGAVIVNEDIMLEEIREDDGTVDIIAVKVKNEKDVPRIKEDIEKLLLKERDVKKGEEDFSVDTPQQTLATLDSTLFAVQMFVTIIAIISLLVGGIGIMNTMYTSVIERTKEIGIMKSIGAKNSTIFSLFFFESGLLGLIGGTIGIAIGMTLAYGMAFMGRLALGSDLIQAEVSLGLIFGALMFAFVLGTLFGVLPAIQASKLQPVESLRSVQ